MPAASLAYSDYYPDVEKNQALGSDEQKMCDRPEEIGGPKIDIALPQSEKETSNYNNELTWPEY